MTHTRIPKGPRNPNDVLEQIRHEREWKDFHARKAATHADVLRDLERTIPKRKK